MDVPRLFTEIPWWKSIPQTSENVRRRSLFALPSAPANRIKSWLKDLKESFQLVFGYLATQLLRLNRNSYNCYQKKVEIPVSYWISLIILLRFPNFSALINYVMEIGSRRDESDRNVIREITVTRISNWLLNI